jgi:cell division protein FtsB
MDVVAVLLLCAVVFLLFVIVGGVAKVEDMLKDVAAEERATGELVADLHLAMKAQKRRDAATGRYTKRLAEV